MLNAMTRLIFFVVSLFRISVCQCYPTDSFELLDVDHSLSDFNALVSIDSQNITYATLPHHLYHECTRGYNRPALFDRIVVTLPTSISSLGVKDLWKFLVKPILRFEVKSLKFYLLLEARDMITLASDIWSSIKRISNFAAGEEVFHTNTMFVDDVVIISQFIHRSLQRELNCMDQAISTSINPTLNFLLKNGTLIDTIPAVAVREVKCIFSLYKGPWGQELVSIDIRNHQDVNIKARLQSDENVIVEFTIPESRELLGM